MLILTITPAPGSYIPQNNYNTTHLSIFLFTHLTPLPGKPMNNCKRCQDSPSTAGEVCRLVLRCPADCSSHDSGKCLQFSGETPPCSRPAAALQPSCSRHAVLHAAVGQTARVLDSGYCDVITVVELSVILVTKPSLGQR